MSTMAVLVTRSLMGHVVQTRAGANLGSRNPCPLGQTKARARAGVGLGIPNRYVDGATLDRASQATLNPYPGDHTQTKAEASPGTQSPCIEDPTLDRTVPTPPSLARPRAELVLTTRSPTAVVRATTSAGLGGPRGTPGLPHGSPTMKSLTSWCPRGTRMQVRDATRDPAGEMQGQTKGGNRAD